MDFQKYVEVVTDKKEDILSLGLSFIFFSLCFVHITLIVMGRNIEEMWVVFGSLALMILLINTQMNFATIFVIIVISTFVADEEFLLEVAAITKGEQLARIRESRNFEVLTVVPEEEVESALTKRLTELLKSKKKPEEIIAALEDHRIELVIKADIPGLDPVDKDVITVFAVRGTVEESDFFQIMQGKGYAVNDIKDSFEKLGASEYLTNSPDNLNAAELTGQGVSLARALGVIAIPLVSG